MLQLTATVYDCDLETVLTIGYQMRVLLHTFDPTRDKVAQWRDRAARIIHWYDMVMDKDTTPTDNPMWIDSMRKARIGLSRRTGFYCCRLYDRKELQFVYQYAGITHATPRNMAMIRRAMPVFAPFADALRVVCNTEVLYKWQRSAF